jgi:hypothetical protein
LGFIHFYEDLAPRVILPLVVRVTNKILLKSESESEDNEDVEDVEESDDELLVW